MSGEPNNKIHRPHIIASTINIPAKQQLQYVKLIIRSLVYFKLYCFLRSKREISTNEDYFRTIEIFSQLTTEILSDIQNIRKNTPWFIHTIITCLACLLKRKENPRAHLTAKYMFYVNNARDLIRNPALSTFPIDKTIPIARLWIFRDVPNLEQVTKSKQKFRIHPTVKLYHLYTVSIESRFYRFYRSLLSRTTLNHSQYFSICEGSYRDIGDRTDFYCAGRNIIRLKNAQIATLISDRFSLGIHALEI